MYQGITRYYLNQVHSPGLNIRELGFHKEFFKVTKILWIVYVWLTRRKAQKTCICFLPPRRLQQFMNSCSALQLQLLEERNILECWLSFKIHAWTERFLVKPVSFYRGALTILFLEGHLSDRLLVGWRLHNWPWLLLQGAAAPCRIHFPLSLLLKDPQLLPARRAPQIWPHRELLTIRVE